MGGGTGKHFIGVTTAKQLAHLPVIRYVVQ